MWPRRSYTLSLRDQGGMEHTVLLNSWANGAGRRDDGRPKSRVYVLEKVRTRRTAVPSGCAARGPHTDLFSCKTQRTRV